MLPGLIWSGVVAPDKVLSIGQIEKNMRTYTKLNFMKYNCFDI